MAAKKKKPAGGARVPASYMEASPGVKGKTTRSANRLIAAAKAKVAAGGQKAKGGTRGGDGEGAGSD